MYPQNNCLSNVSDKTIREYYALKAIRDGDQVTHNQVRYGRLTLLSLIQGKGSKARGLFKCDCGKDYVARIDSVKGKRYPSCGCWGKEIRKEKCIKRSKVSDLVGMKFGRLLVTATDNDAERKRSLVRAVCLCDCGAQAIIRASHLKNGKAKSCGCAQIEWANSDANKSLRTKHAHTTIGKIQNRYTSIYIAWIKVRRSCNRDRGFSYHKVCHDYDKRWDDFKEFFKDFGNIRDDQTISRIDNQTSWCKENCYVRTTKDKGTSRG